MRISDWSSDVCSSDLTATAARADMPKFSRLLAVLAVLTLTGCGINTVPTREEAAKAAWAGVENQYQRRADLVPNLVATVKGFAEQERQVLEEVTKARASAKQTHVDADRSEEQTSDLQ